MKTKLIQLRGLLKSAGSIFERDLAWVARRLPALQWRLGILNQDAVFQGAAASIGRWRWNERLVLALMLAAFLVGCTTRDSTATYPRRAIDLIVPWSAGGGTDRVARFIADALQRRLGQPVIVINRTGGSGAVGHSAGALAAPDGYTLTMATFELSTMHSMGISKLTWKNFVPVAQVNADAAAILVRQDAPWKNLGELLEVMRKEPGKVKMSGTSTGGAWDLARSGLMLSAGISPVQAIWAPTQGSAPALVELLGGHIDVVCCSVPEAASLLEGGQLRVLAVLSPERLQDFPAYPTAREQGVAYDAVGWRGIMVPKGTPPALVTLLSEHLSEIAASEEFRHFMRKNGFGIEVRTGESFADFLRAEDARWREVIKSAGYETLGRNHDPGPRTMPLLLGSFLALCLVLETVRSRRGGSADRVAREEAPGFGGCLSSEAVFLLGAVVIYVAVMPWIGFTLSTVAFTLTVMLRLGVRWVAAGVGSILIVTTIHLLFVTLFKVQLP